MGYIIDDNIKNRINILFNDRFYFKEKFSKNIRTTDIIDIKNFYRNISNIIYEKINSNTDKIKSITLFNFEIKDEKYLDFKINNENYLAYYILYNHIKNMEITEEDVSINLKKTLDDYRGNIPNVFYIEFKSGYKYIGSFSILNTDNSNKKIFTINNNYLYEILYNDIEKNYLLENIKNSFLYYSIMEYLRNKFDNKYFNSLELKDFSINLREYCILFKFSIGEIHKFNLDISIMLTDEERFYVNIDYDYNTEDIIEIDINEEDNEIILNKNDYEEVKNNIELMNKLYDINESYEENHDIIYKIYAKICNTKNIIRLFEYELNKYTTDFTINMDLIKSSLSNSLAHTEYNVEREVDG